MNYYELTERLKNVSPDEYEYEAKVFIESFTHYSMPYILAHKDEDIAEEKLDLALERRENHEPLQYIVGMWEFYRQQYLLTHDCLIPRSDTEILVEKAIELLPKGAFFADFCSGSGCIGVSTLAERPDTTALFVEKYEMTMHLTHSNAKINKVQDRAQCLLIDLLADDEKLAGMKFDAILSNPPYIRPEVIETLAPEVKFEPYAALYGGEDGLIFYRKIIGDYSTLVKKDGFMLLEIGYDQADDVISIAKQKGLTCEIIKDYGGNDRVAYIKGF